MSKLIERQRALEIIANVDNYGDGVAYEVLGHAYRDVALIPTVDAIPVIRCKDCKHYRYVLGYIDGLCGRAEWYKRYQREDDYCSRAERKKNE